MNIIFGKQTAEQAQEKYTVLPLDLLQIEPNGPVIDTYCLIEKEQLPLEEIGQMENFVRLHIKLMENYRKKNWNFCEQALEHLHGRWGGTINSFYDEISRRVDKYKQEDPGPDWNGIYEKYNRGN